MSHINNHYDLFAGNGQKMRYKQLFGVKRPPVYNEHGLNVVALCKSLAEIKLIGLSAEAWRCLH